MQTEDAHGAPHGTEHGGDVPEANAGNGGSAYEEAPAHYGPRVMELGGVVGLEVKDVIPPASKNAQVRRPRGCEHVPQELLNRERKVRVGFLLELNKTDKFISSLHGKYGLAAFYRILRTFEDAGVQQVHLIVRLFENATKKAAKQGVLWPSRESKWKIRRTASPSPPFEKSRSCSV